MSVVAHGPLVYNTYEAGEANMLRAGYKTPTHLDNSDKPDTKIV